jgi:hypothetical protein
MQVSTIFNRSPSIKLALALAISGFLAGCGVATTTSQATPQPTIVATIAPTAAPTTIPTAQAIEPTSKPTVEPTAAPTVEALLPAPLYFISNSPTEPSHIVRLERDGETRTPLLDEAPSQDFLTITEFDVSPADGSLVYIIQGQNGNSLIKTGPDGQERTVLLADVSVSTPRWSPDGKTIAVAVFQAPEATDGLAGGIYLIPADGGEPKLLQASDTVDDPANPSPEARGFAPKAWSPDGRQLLLGTFSLAVELCGTAVKDVTSSSLVDVIAPEGLAACEGGVWSTDGSAIYIGMTRPGYMAPVPGLWRADTATGEVQPYIVGEPEQGTFTLVRGVHPLKDGSVYALLATTDKLPDPGVDENVVWPQFTLSQVSADGTEIEKLSDASYENPGESIRWAGDSSGAVIEQYNPQGATLLWLPADDAEPVVIAEGVGAGEVRWGALE